MPKSNNDKFKTDIADFIKVSDERMVALMQKSINDVVDIAQTPVAKGGKMRVDTNFLRHSGAGSLEKFPSGESHSDLREPNSHKYDGSSLMLVLSKMKVGDTFYWGWVAHYARYREIYDGFMGGAIQQWNKIVAANTEEIRKRIKK